MKTWTIGRRLLIGISALVALVLSVAALALFVGRSLEERLINTDDHTVKRLNLVLQIETELERLYATEPALVAAGFMNEAQLVEAKKLAVAEAVSEVSGSLDAFKAEAESLTEKGIKAAGPRARKATLEIEKLLKEFRITSNQESIV